MSAPSNSAAGTIGYLKAIRIMTRFDGTDGAEIRGALDFAAIRGAPPELG
jgi:hypothetical protein